MIQRESQAERWIQKATARTARARAEQLLHNRNRLQLAQDTIFEYGKCSSVRTRGKVSAEQGMVD